MLSDDVSRSTVYLLLLVAAAGLLLATIWLMLTRFFTKAIMHITLVASIVLNMCVWLLLNRFQSSNSNKARYAPTTGSPSTTVRPPLLSPTPADPYH